MKTALIIFAFFFASVVTCFAQNGRIDSNKIHYRELSFYSTKEQIIAKLGKPSKTLEPNYECGFVSSQEQGKRYYQMQYSKASFIGNTEEKYLIDQIKFDAKSNTVVSYDQWRLSHATSVKDFIKIFGTSVEFSEPKGGIAHAFIPFVKHGEDGLIFVFKNRVLIELNYWSPC